MEIKKRLTPGLIAALVFSALALIRDVVLGIVGTQALYGLDPTMFFIVSRSGTFLICLVLLSLLYDYFKYPSGK